MALLQQAHLLKQGAIGIFCASEDARRFGGSQAFARPFQGLPVRTDAPLNYFRSENLSNPLASPILDRRGHGSHRRHLWQATTPHDRVLYKLRNRIERCFNKLKHFGRLATRYCKRRTCFQATVALACAWLHLVKYVVRPS